MDAAGADRVATRNMLKRSAELEGPAQAPDWVQTVASPVFQRVVQRAIHEAHALEDWPLSGVSLLIALLSEQDTTAVRILRGQGLGGCKALKIAGRGSHLRSWIWSFAAAAHRIHKQRPLWGAAFPSLSPRIGRSTDPVTILRTAAIAPWPPESRLSGNHLMATGRAGSCGTPAFGITVRGAECPQLGRVAVVEQRPVHNVRFRPSCSHSSEVQFSLSAFDLDPAGDHCRSQFVALRIRASHRPRRGLIFADRETRESQPLLFWSYLVRWGSCASVRF